MTQEDSKKIETPKMRILTIEYQDHPARNASCLSYVTLLEQKSSVIGFVGTASSRTSALIVNVRAGN